MFLEEPRLSVQGTGKVIAAAGILLFLLFAGFLCWVAFLMLTPSPNITRLLEDRTGLAIFLGTAALAAASLLLAYGALATTTPGPRAKPGAILLLLGYACFTLSALCLLAPKAGFVTRIEAAVDMLFLGTWLCGLGRAQRAGRTYWDPEQSGGLWKRALDVLLLLMTAGVISGALVAVGMLLLPFR